jgi:hypothetical protein
MAREPRYTGG